MANRTINQTEVEAMLALLGYQDDDMVLEVHMYAQSIEVERYNLDTRCRDSDRIAIQK